jgi:hypothetical protein
VVITTTLTSTNSVPKIVRNPNSSAPRKYPNTTATTGFTYAYVPTFVDDCLTVSFAVPSSCMKSQLKLRVSRCVHAEGRPMRNFCEYFVVLFVLSLAGCGGSGTGSPTPMPLSVTLLAPSSSQILIGQTAQFSASVQNAANSAVTWDVNSTPGGNATVGTITSAGLYTAPTVIPNSGSIQITAVSVQDPSKSASTTITLASNISVSISPSTVSVAVGFTQQFGVSLQNAFNVAVTWEVNGTVGGSQANGTITNTGLYTAPATLPSQTSVTVTAVSVADPTKSGSAAVTITPPIAVSVSPSPSVVFVGSTLQLTATVLNASNNAVSWNLGTQIGSISSAGLYTPPVNVSAPTVVTVTATSVADATKSGSASIIVNLRSSNDSALTGHYVFSGTTPCASCSCCHETISAGSFVADGNGTLTSAVLDWINVGYPSSQQTPPRNAIGAYSVDSNNQGTVVFVAASGGSLRVGGFSFGLGSFSQGTAQRAQILLTGEGGNGIMLAQDSTALSTSALNGDYSFGSSVDTFDGAVAGLFHADGAGNLTSGFLDVNEPSPSSPPNLQLSNAPFTGTYTVDPNSGRGTATMNVPTIGSIFTTFYVISAKEVFWFGTMPNDNAFSGSALQQQGGPFSNQSWNATSVFALGSACDCIVNSMPFVGSAGLLTADGNGNVSGVVDGTVDTSGAVLQNQPVSGTYSVSRNGRGTLNIFNQTFVIYLVSQNSAFILEEPNNILVQTGLIEPQAGGIFNTASISGTFIGGGNSSSLDQTIGVSQDAIGLLSSDGAGNITGNLISNSGNFAATYSVSSNGRGTLNQSAPFGATFTLYLTSANKFVTVRTSVGTLSFFGP